MEIDNDVNDFLNRTLGYVEESRNEPNDFDLYTIYDSLGNEITHRAYYKKNAKFDEHGNLVSVSLGDQFRIFCEYKDDLLKTCKFGNRVYYIFNYDAENRLIEYTVETKKNHFIEKISHKFEYNLFSENEIIATETITDITEEKTVFLEKYQYTKTPDSCSKKLI